MRIAVLGSGGIGGYFGGRLAAAGHDVTFLARGPHLEALTRDGLHLRSAAGDLVLTPTHATDDPSSIGEVDVVILAVKTWQVPSLLSVLPALVGRDGVVVTTQNGVEAPAQVAAVVGRKAVLPGIAKIFAYIEAPGRIVHGGTLASLSLAEWDSRPSRRVDEIRAALTGAGVNSPVPHDIWAELWAKVLFVVPFGGLGAALSATIGEIRDDPDTRSLLADAMREVEAVARANDIDLPAGVVDGTMAFVDTQPPEVTTSLQRDLLAGRPSELDAWTGAVVRLGAAAAAPVPIHRLLLAVLTRRHPDALPPAG